MLKKLINLLTKQQRIKGAGEFVETLSLTLFWGSVVNIIMNAGTFYYTTLRHLIPWFDIGTFIIVMGVGVVIAYIITFKFIAPSLWAFRGKMMNNDTNTKNSDDNLTDKDKVEKAMKLLQEVMSKNDK